MNPNIHLVFVCNKVDMTDERVIPDADLLAVSSAFGDGTFFLTSAKTGEQVEEVFICLADKIDAGS